MSKDDSGEDNPVGKKRLTHPYHGTPEDQAAYLAKRAASIKKKSDAWAAHKAAKNDQGRKSTAKRKEAEAERNARIGRRLKRKPK